MQIHPSIWPISVRQFEINLSIQYQCQNYLDPVLQTVYIKGLQTTADQILPAKPFYPARETVLSMMKK